MQKKYQIFLSSTYNDLKIQRESLIKICLQMGHHPMGMEMFNPADEEQWKIITNAIDGSDYYVVIVAHRYGTRLDGISYTEKEYRYAKSTNVPILRFIIHETAQWPSNLIDIAEPDRIALNAFKYELSTKMVAFWNSDDDLRLRFSLALPQAIQIHPRPGWTRVVDNRYEDAFVEVTRLSKENTSLRTEIDSLRELTSSSHQYNAVLADLRKREIEILRYPSVESRQENKAADRITVSFLELFADLAADFSRGIREDHIVFSAGQRLYPGRFRSIEIPSVDSFLSHLCLIDLVQVQIIAGGQTVGGHPRISRIYTLTFAGREVARDLILFSANQ